MLLLCSQLVLKGTGSPGKDSSCAKWQGGLTECADTKAVAAVGWRDGQGRNAISYIHL